MIDKSDADGNINVHLHPNKVRSRTIIYSYYTRYKNKCKFFENITMYIQNGLKKGVELNIRD